MHEGALGQGIRRTVCTSLKQNMEYVRPVQIEYI